GHRANLYGFRVGFDPERDYPVGLARPDLVTTPGGIPLAELSLDADGLDAAELRATPATLRLQAEVARAAERTQLADNLLRDPEPSLVLEGDHVVELDGRGEADWDALDHFIARYGLDSEAARDAAALADLQIARMLVDVDVPRAALVRLSRGLTPARLARILGLLDPVELMFALKKLRARRAPANQAHVTNL